MASCIICFTIYSSDDIIILLNCQHCYHKRCIENWTKVRTECPQCRRKIQYAKSTKIYLNFTGQMDGGDDADKKPNVTLCRLVKASTNKIKTQEMLLTDKKLEIMNLHRLLQESKEQIDTVERQLNCLLTENNELRKKMEMLVMENVTYVTNFLTFRSKYDQIVQQMLDKIVEVKKSLVIDANAFPFEALKRIGELIYMVRLVQAKDRDSSGIPESPSIN